MKKVRIRCDYCGIEHRGTIENDTLKIERYSAYVYEDETEDIQPELSTIKVGGTNFRCICGGNVFRNKGTIYECNACGSEYEEDVQPLNDSNDEPKKSDAEDQGSSN